LTVAALLNAVGALLYINGLLMGCAAAIHCTKLLLSSRRSAYDGWSAAIPITLQHASVPLLTDDSQIGANLRVCADEENRADLDQRG
jgi:hypothetical protein